MSPAELRAVVERLDRDASRALLALHALEDAPDAPGRIIAFRALTGAVGRVSSTAARLDAELRLKADGVRS